MHGAPEERKGRHGKKERKERKKGRKEGKKNLEFTIESTERRNEIKKVFWSPSVGKEKGKIRTAKTVWKEWEARWVETA